MMHAMSPIQNILEILINENGGYFESCLPAQREIIGSFYTNPTNKIDLKIYPRRSGVTTSLLAAATELAFNQKNVAYIVPLQAKATQANEFLSTRYAQTKNGEWAFGDNGKLTVSNISEDLFRGRKFDYIIGDGLIYHNSIALLLNIMGPLAFPNGEIRLFDTF